MMLGPCDDWPGPRFDEKGYGLDGGRRAHIVAWERVHGPVPQQTPRLVLRHRCNRPPCRRVDHLVLGTDKRARGSMTKRAKASDVEARELAALDAIRAWRAARDAWRVAAVRADMMPTPRNLTREAVAVEAFNAAERAARAACHRASE